jgi:hypothetical protein
MPRNHRANEIVKIARAKRQSALERNELRQPSEARVSAAGVTSFSIKDADPELSRMIADFLAKRGAA